MTWAKIDDRANEHRKQLAAGAEACWLWTCGLMYANRQPARDGFIPEIALSMLYPFKSPKRLAEKLVDVGLWHRAEGGYVVHQFNQWNQTKEERDAELAEGRRRAAESYARRKRDSSPEEKPKRPPKSDPKKTGVFGDSSGSLPLPSPSDSDPTTPKPPEQPRQPSPDAKVRCPVPLPIDDQTFAGLTMDVGIPRDVAEAALLAWARQQSADASDLRTVGAWVKCAIPALRGRWTDPAKKAEMRALVAAQNAPERPDRTDALKAQAARREAQHAAEAARFVAENTGALSGSVPLPNLPGGDP